MSNDDWLPRKEQDLADLIEVWILILSDAANVTAFGWIQADVTEVLGKLNAFPTARAAYVADDSSARLHAKNAARDTAKDAMRDFANSSVRYNKRVDDETKERLLNGKKDTTRTDVPDPTEIAAFTLENAGYLQIMVKHPPRPPRYNGAVARYKVGGNPPANHKELTESKLLTRPHEILTFGDEALGQTLYIALYWQNEKGRLGPPSPIQSHVIA